MISLDKKCKLPTIETMQYARTNISTILKSFSGQCPRVQAFSHVCMHTKICVYKDCILVTRFVFKVHMKVHSSEKKFKCGKCEMKFRHKNSLVRHRWQHEDTRPQQCKECGRQFVSTSRLKSHAKIHMKTDGDDLKNNVGKDAEEEEENNSLCYLIFDVIELSEF